MKKFLNVLVGVTFLGIAIYLAIDVEGVVGKVMGVLIFGFGAFRSFKAIGQRPAKEETN